ncbi:MAG TPA: hypothetical protein VG165_15130 [Solirubrobacteraceae bacterium]|jgi:hypothetical protein|nr:hypothetical protein [Solirubrobacteraceae bacterium]
MAEPRPARLPAWKRGRPAGLTALAAVVVSAVSAAVSVCDVALADGPAVWSTPAVVVGSTRPAGSLPTSGPGVLQLGFTPTGLGVVSLPAGGLVIPLPPAKPSEDLGTLSAPIVGDSVGPASRLSARTVLHLVTVGPDSVLAALSPIGSSTRPVVAEGPIGGALGRVETIGQPGQSIKALVADARGDVAALLESCAPGGGHCGRHHLSVAVRLAGGRFAKPSLLAGSAGSVTPGLAIGPTGDVLVAWVARTGSSRHVFARLRFVSGRVGPAQLLGPTLDEGSIAPVLGAGDSAIVGWSSASYGLDGAGSPATFRIAIAGEGGRFRSVHTLDSWNVPGTYTPAPIYVVSTPDGAGLVAWQGHTAAGFDVAVARVVGVEVLPPELSPPGGDATLEGLAAGPHGASIVVWSEGGDLEAGSAPPTQPLTGPELVAGGGAGVYGVSAAFDPVTGRPLVAWYGSDEQSVEYSVRSPI